MASSLTPLAIGHGGHDRHHDAPTAGRPSLDPPGSDFDWQAIAQLQTSGVGDDQSIAEWEHRLNQLLPNLTQGVLRPGENHATDDNIRQLVQVLQTALELKTAILADTEAELAQSQDVLTQRARRKSDRDEDDDAAFDRELQRVEVERDEADARYQATLQQLQTERERQSQTEALRRQLLEENAALRDQMMSLKERLAVVTNAPLSPVDHSHAQHDRATIAALETEIRALTEQNSEWEAEHVRLLEELMAVMDHFEQSQAEQRRLAQAVVEGDELLTQMGKDRSHLKHQLQHLSAQIQSRGQMDDSLLTDIQRELLKSQSQLAFYKDLVAQKDEALVAAQAAQTEIQQALSSSQTTQLRAEIAARDQEIKHLHREFAVQQHDFALLAEEWDHLVQREEGAVTDSAQSRHASSLISRLRTQNERQKTAIAKLLRNLRHARQTLVDREGEFLKHMRVAGRGEVQALRSEIMTLRDEAMTLQKQYHTAMDLLAEKDLLLAHLDTADLAQFEQAVQRAVAAHQPVQMACDSAAYLDAASEPLREALAQAQRRNQQLKDKLAKAVRMVRELQHSTREVQSTIDVPTDSPSPPASNHHASTDSRDLSLVSTHRRLTDHTASPPDSFTEHHRRLLASYKQLSRSVRKMSLHAFHRGEPAPQRLSTQRVPEDTTWPSTAPSIRPEARLALPSTPGPRRTSIPSEDGAASAPSTGGLPLGAFATLSGVAEVLTPRWSPVKVATTAAATTAASPVAMVPVPPTVTASLSPIVTATAMATPTPVDTTASMTTPAPVTTASTATASPTTTTTPPTARATASSLSTLQRPQSARSVLIEMGIDGSITCCINRPAIDDTRPRDAALSPVFAPVVTSASASAPASASLSASLPPAHEPETTVKVGPLRRTPLSTPSSPPPERRAHGSVTEQSPRPEPEPAIPGLDPAKVEALFLCLSDRLESTAEQGALYRGLLDAQAADAAAERSERDIQAAELRQECRRVERQLRASLAIAKATQRDPSSPGSERPPLPEQTAHMRAIRAQLQAQVHRAVALQAQLEAQQRQRTDEVARLRHELERETEQGCQLDRARRQLQNEQNVLQQEVETLTGTTATLRERLSARGIARSRHQLMKAQQRLRASQRQTATLQECLQLTKERLDAVTDWFTVTMPTIPGTPLVPVADRDPKLLEYPLPEATS